jgi:hypothetical protein
MAENTPVPLTAKQSKKFMAAELLGHRVAISNPNTRTWNTTLIDVASGYEIANATAITIHGSLRKDQEVYELTATITLLHLDTAKVDWEEEVTVGVHSIVTQAQIENVIE